MITGFPAVIDTARRMVRGANVMSLPVVVTEQYPAKLGATVSELKEVLPQTAPVVSKTMFSMLTPEVEVRLRSDCFSGAGWAGAESRGGMLSGDTGCSWPLAGRHWGPATNPVHRPPLPPAELPAAERGDPPGASVRH